MFLIKRWTSSPSSSNSFNLSRRLNQSQYCPASITVDIPALVKRKSVGRSSFHCVPRMETQAAVTSSGSVVVKSGINELVRSSDKHFLLTRYSISPAKVSGLIKSSLVSLGTSNISFNKMSSVWGRQKRPMLWRIANQTSSGRMTRGVPQSYAWQADQINPFTEPDTNDVIDSLMLREVRASLDRRYKYGEIPLRTSR